MVLKTLYIIVALFILLSLYVFQKFVRIVVNLFLGISIKTQPPLTRGRESESIWFEADDGNRLRGWFWRGDHEGESKGSIIFCHEFGSSGESALLYADFLLDAGFDIFGLDFRGHGESSCRDSEYEPRHWTTCRELSDARGAIRYMKSRDDVCPDRIGMMGISRGGAAALAAAEDLGVRAVFCDSAFSTWATLDDYMHRWVSIYAYLPIIYNNLPQWFFWLLGTAGLKVSEMRIGVKFVHLEKLLKQYTGATCFVHGARDTYIRDRQAKYLSGLVAGPTSFHIIHGAKHNGSRAKDPETYEQLALEFFQKYLAVKEPKGVSLRVRGS